MAKYNKLWIFLTLFFILSCSSSYKNLNHSNFSPPDDFSRYLFNTYKEKANFEAEKMHDWNSAKLYSEKALDAANGKKVLPQQIDYWKLPKNPQYQIIQGYNNLMAIYQSAAILDPFNLANAISSLDCWSEQQEENWQTWDINKCRKDFLKSMHAIYKSIKKNEKKQTTNKSSQLLLDDEVIKNNTALVTEGINKNILQIVYFDFDKSVLSSVSEEEIKDYINKYKKIIKKYIVVGHTDTKGSIEYNYNLSIERAKVVKNLLVDMGIESINIKILGKGESDLNIKTKDEVPHPANRRAEIRPLN